MVLGQAADKDVKVDCNLTRTVQRSDLLLSDRNREDFRFVNGDSSFRYGNRVTLEREVHLLKGRTITL